MVVEELKQELIAYKALADAAIEWCEDIGTCHFCGLGLPTGEPFGPIDQVRHDADCPVLAVIGMRTTKEVAGE